MKSSFTARTTSFLNRSSRRIITTQNEEGVFIKEPEKLPEPLERLIIFLKDYIMDLSSEQPLQSFWGFFGGIDAEMSKALPRALHAAFYDELHGWLHFEGKNPKYAGYFIEDFDEQILDQINAVQQFDPRLAEEPTSPHDFYEQVIDKHPALRLAPYWATVRMGEIGHRFNRMQQQQEEAEDFDAYEDFQTHPAKRALNLVAEIKATAKFDVRENLKASPELRAAIRDIDKDLNEVMSAVFETLTARRIWRVRRHELYGVSFEPHPTQHTDTLFKIVFDISSPKAMREVRELVSHRIFQALVAGHICHAAYAATSIRWHSITLDIGEFERALGIDDPNSEKFQATREALRLAHMDPASQEAREAIKDLQDLVTACRLAFQFLGREDVVEFAPD